MWLERAVLHLLHPSQKTAFSETPLHAEFCDYFDAAVGVARTDPLKYFERDIAEAKNRYLAQCARLIGTPKRGRKAVRASSNDSPRQSLFFEENEDSDIADTRSVQTGSQKKRKQAQPSQTSAGNHMQRPVLANSLLNPTPRSPTSVTSQSTPQPPQQPIVSVALPLPYRPFPGADQDKHLPMIMLPDGTQAQVQVKTEAEEHQFNFGKTVGSNDRVSMFVGRDSRPFLTDRRAIEKSGVLAAQIQQDPKHGKFVMHPDLTNADRQDALAMLQFMQDGEYVPRCIPRQDGRAGPYQLKQKFHPYEYSDEVVRAAKLWILSQNLNVQGFADHILHKLKNSQYFKYTNLSLMQCAAIIFGEQGSTARDSRQPMELWLINMIAENFKEIMNTTEQREFFWRMEERTARRKMVRDIYARAAEKYHVLGGMPIVID